MKYNKGFLLSALSLFTVASLVACSKGTSSEPMNDWGYNPEKKYEIGDTAKEWKSDKDWKYVPLELAEGEGGGAFVKNLGHDDNSSIHFNIKSESGYITSERGGNNFFTDLDAKNGDIVSLYVYVPSNSNLALLQLELRSLEYPSGNGWEQTMTSDVIPGTKLVIDADKENKWIRLEASYDTLYALGSVRVNFIPINKDQLVEFYVDDINITYGSETIETKYESNDESLSKKYKDYFIVGTELSANMAKNTKYREIAKDNFNSVTAENEAKPQNTLDQKACQELAKIDETAVAITTKPFEQIYDWCEANHIKVRHHTFVWHQQTPGWFFKQGYSDSGARVSREIMLARLDNFFKVTIETLDERWPGLVYALDVVNEAIEEVDKIRSGDWRTTVGDDFIYQAFVAAHRHKKDYQDLYYNDYAFDQEKWHGVERCQWAVDTLLRQAIDEGIIDGIGLQAHIEEPKYADAVIKDAQIICEAGIKCQITELDIDCSSNSEKEFETQKNLYRKIVGSVLEGNASGTMNVNAIIVWGITDNLSWHPNRTPLMFKEDYSKKPAYYGFLEALDAFRSGDTFLPVSD